MEREANQSDRTDEDNEVILHHLEQSGKHIKLAIDYLRDYLTACELPHDEQQN